ncbi:hypothetical protein CDL15_Pgr012398 [Punica granatum]|nr:hypothetical protein CDL15_Pgr012398 [Punica granatum]
MRAPTRCNFSLHSHEITQACKDRHLHRVASHYRRLKRGIPVPPLSHFSPGPAHIINGTLDSPSSNWDNLPVALPAINVVTEKTPPRVYVRLAHENEELNN